MDYKNMALTPLTLQYCTIWNDTTNNPARVYRHGRFGEELRPKKESTNNAPFLDVENPNSLSRILKWAILKDSQSV